MSDFAQNGVICTLQQLNATHLHALDGEWLPDLGALGPPVHLLVPCHAPDLESAALRHICEQLRPARWLARVVFSINGLAPGRLDAVRRWLRSVLPCEVHAFCTDSPPLLAVLGAAAGALRRSSPRVRG